jgi:hypothetical protein
VEVVVKLDSQENLQKSKAVFSLHLPGNAGIHLHATANDNAAKRRLNTMKTKLEQELGLELEERFDATSQK